MIDDRPTEGRAVGQGVPVSSHCPMPQSVFRAVTSFRGENPSFRARSAPCWIKTRSSCPGRTFTLGGLGKRLEQHRGVGAQGAGDELGKGGYQTMPKETGEMELTFVKCCPSPTVNVLGLAA